jgi:CBS domain-containing protein
MLVRSSIRCYHPELSSHLVLPTCLCPTSENGTHLANFLGMKSVAKQGNGNNLILEDVVAFLKKVPPFQFLDDGDLQAVARNLSMEFYPRDTVVLKQDGAPSDALRIIKKGGIKVSMSPEDGAEVVIDYRGEGDTFGFLSMVGKDRVRSNITAVEDTICYLLGKEMLLKLLDSHLSFTEYFLKSHITKYIDRTYREMQDKSMFYGGSDRLLFTTRVGDMAIKDVVSSGEDTSIREAARIMSENRISSLIIMNGNNVPTGIVTDRDLREKVVARDRSVQEPIKNIMSTTLIRVDAHDYCFEAVLRMLKYNIHHILVISDGKLSGVITNHDLMMLQGTSPLSLTKDIECQQTIEGLVPVSKKINNIVGLLMKEGAKASNITKVITEINDRLVRKVVEISERKTGKPPVPYSWIVFGSEGRKEQTFKTDQDNAVIYADPETDAGAEAARNYFAALAESVRDGLLQCGFPLCPANYMAANPQWRQPLKAWKKYFSTWIATPTPDAVLNSVAFFDFRHMAGDALLAEQLRDYLNSQLKDQKVFLGYLANMAIRNTPPIGFFKSFVVEKDGEHKDQLNLKVKGIAPFVDIMRLFALEKGIRETSTLERIETLRSTHTIVEEYADDLEQAFEFITFLRIHHQYAQISSGQGPDNFINPNKLSNLERRSIKEAFQLISTVQDLIIERYKSLIW